MIVNGPGQLDTLAGGTDGPAIFQWATMQEIDRHNLIYHGTVVQGTRFGIQLTNQQTVRVWSSSGRQEYFCHGLTFRGKIAPGGPISPYSGKPVETILEGYFQIVAEAQAPAGDILVWKGLAPETTPHSAVLSGSIIAAGKDYLDSTATLQTKNGLSPEANMTLQQLIEIYGESYNVYRKRQTQGVHP